MPSGKNRTATRPPIRACSRISTRGIRPPTGIPDSTTAYILFTSGTTSKPKGVEITHRNLHAQMQTFIRHYGITEQSRLMNLLPLHHTDGLTHGAFVGLIGGHDALPTLALQRRRAAEHVGRHLQASHHSSHHRAVGFVVDREFSATTISTASRLPISSSSSPPPPISTRTFGAASSSAIACAW